MRYLVIIAAITQLLLGGCATSQSSQTYHSFSIEIDGSVSKVRNLKYLYGDLGWRENPIAEPPGSLSILTGPMSIPEFFEVSWTNTDGSNQKFSVPVRSKISTRMHGKGVHFVIMQDHVEGYVLTKDPSNPLGRNLRSRFF